MKGHAKAVGRRIPGAVFLGVLGVTEDRSRKQEKSDERNR